MQYISIGEYLLPSFKSLLISPLQMSVIQDASFDSGAAVQGTKWNQ